MSKIYKILLIVAVVGTVAVIYFVPHSRDRAVRNVHDKDGGFLSKGGDSVIYTKSWLLYIDEKLANIDTNATIVDLCRKVWVSFSDERMYHYFQVDCPLNQMMKYVGMKMPNESFVSPTISSNMGNYDSLFKEQAYLPQFMLMNCVSDNDIYGGLISGFKAMNYEDQRVYFLYDRNIELLMLFNFRSISVDELSDPEKIFDGGISIYIFNKSLVISALLRIYNHSNGLLLRTYRFTGANLVKFDRIIHYPNDPLKMTLGMLSEYAHGCVNLEQPISNFEDGRSILGNLYVSEIQELSRKCKKN